MTADLLLRNVRAMGGAAGDIAIRAGRIAAMGPDLPDADLPIHDGGGLIALPGLVEAHTHLDKSLIGMPWYRNAVGPRLIDKIENERAERQRLPIDPRLQSERHVRQISALGTTHIRGHVDIDTECGLRGIEGVMATRAALADLVDIQIVAFPQSGLLIRPGTFALMEQAMRFGADVVGGLDPCAIDRDPKGHLDAVFGLAERFGKPVDIHLHEPGEMGAFSLELIVERTRALGMAGRVTISHAFCLGVGAESAVAALVASLAEAGVSILTTAPPSRPVPAVRQLIDAGVVVAAGSDGIRDTWGPYGNGDMLERAMLVGMRNNFRRDDELALAFETVTAGGARLMGLADYGLAVGCAADVVLVQAETLAEAVATRPARRMVIKRGRVV